jgi:NADH-quinone oxidoreductase subunit L
LSFFEVTKANSLKVLFILISSFVIILFTYEAVGHVLEGFLYGEHAQLLYDAATLFVSSGMTIVMLLAIMAVGWYFTYRQHYVDVPIGEHQPSKTKWKFYKLLAKEGYISDIYVKYFKIF